MVNKQSLFGYQFDNMTYEETLIQINQFLKSDRFYYILTVNPEIILASDESEALHQAILNADLVFADGVGLILANRLINRTKLNKITGSDLTPQLLRLPLKCYFIGAHPDIIEKAIYSVKNTYPNIAIVGFHHGYFQEKEEPQIIDEIKKFRPDIVFVGMGAPKQESFLMKLKSQLDHGVGIGIGGMFDILSGTKSRAPLWTQRLGIEWVYRGLIEPKRIKRWIFIPSFFKRVLSELHF